MSTRGTTMRTPPRTPDLRTAYEDFLTTGRAPRGVRPLVVASWRRSARSGVDPDAPAAEVALDDARLGDHRRHHPLAAAMPVLRELLVTPLADEPIVVAVTDDAGRLLWVEGNHRVRDAVGRLGFVEGAVWREERVGTNAPGTALATRRPVQVLGAEHFTRPVQGLNCAAAPVHDLRTGRVLGVLDVTGGPAAGSAVAMSLVRASVAAVERELVVRAGVVGGAGLVGPHDVAPHLGADLAVAGGAVDAIGGRPVATLEVLGARDAVLVQTGPAVTERLRLTTRHAEILLLLARHPRGLGADELAVLLHPGDLSGVTVRAEVSRLRRVVGPLLADGAPYRLARPLRTDVGAVRLALAAGDVDGALATYAGPALPRSVAPGVEMLRAELAAEVRAAVLAAPDPGPLERWVSSDEGADDVEAWTRLAHLAPARSPLAVRARARVALLDAVLR